MESCGPTSGRPIGEVGTLEDVVRSHIIDDKIFLFIKSDGFRYMSFITFDDPGFCNKIYRLMKSRVGRAINEIGDIDLSYSPKARGSQRPEHA